MTGHLGVFSNCLPWWSHLSHEISLRSFAYMAHIFTTRFLDSFHHGSGTNWCLTNCCWLVMWVLWKYQFESLNGLEAFIVSPLPPPQHSWMILRKACVAFKNNWNPQKTAKLKELKWWGLVSIVLDPHVQTNGIIATLTSSFKGHLLGS